MGFHVQLLYQGMLVAHDIEALEDYFASLLSSANTVEAIKTLMAEIKSSD